MRKTHCLKMWPEYYMFVENGQMNFQLRANDRDFQPGDILVLQEWDPENKSYSRKETIVYITYILTGGNFGLPDNLCILGISLNL